MVYSVFVKDGFEKLAKYQQTVAGKSRASATWHYIIVCVKKAFKSCGALTLGKPHITEDPFGEKV
jgi:hypothetical protein